MADVFPRSNLPPDAVAWGRAVENEARNLSNAVISLGISSAGDNRASAGQMGALGRQVSELASRSNVTLFGDSISVTRTSGQNWASATRNISIPGASGGTRAAFVSVVASPSMSGPDAFAAWYDISSEGVTIGKGTVPIQNSSYPPGFTAIVNEASILQVPVTGSTISIRLWGLSLQNTNTVTLSGITANVLYADRV